MTIVSSIPRPSFCAPPGFRSVEARIAADWSLGQPRAYGRADDLRLFGGYHERMPGSDYDWHGRLRGGDPQRPSVSIQYTLAGEGRYHDLCTGHEYACMPGVVFIAVIPSDHRYWLPVHSAGWRFVWIDVALPAAVERIVAAARRVAPVLTVAPDGPCVAALLALLDGARGVSITDEQALDRAIVEIAWTFAAAARAADPLAAERSRFLVIVDEVLSRGPAPRVTELARRAGLTRAAFTRAFTKAVGESPAQHLLNRRLAQARQMLVSSQKDLAEVAAACGFADPTHLGKAFRRRFHITPGRWRAQG